MANLSHFRRCRALLSSPKMSLYQQRGTTQVLMGWGRSLRDYLECRREGYSPCHGQRLCAYFTRVGGGERGCLPKLVLTLHCGTWPAVVERGLEQCPLRWGVLRVSRVLCRLSCYIDIPFSRGEGRQGSGRILYKLPPCDSHGRQGTGG